MPQNSSSEASFQPIGVVRCPQYYRYEAARQPALAPDNEAIIELRDEPGYKEALKDLAGFGRVWIIYEFHLNESWQPLVQPPRAGLPRLGVFATRSPHRPNRIGLSCVELSHVDGLNLHVRCHDLLDKTPVLDIKPYLPYADAFPDVKAGWVDEADLNKHNVQWQPEALKKAQWIKETGKLDAVNFAAVQLGTDPTDTDRKRVRQVEGNTWVISYRTFRLDFTLDENARSITVTDVHSGYSTEDLTPGTKDRHKDKDLHRQFLKKSW